MTTTTPSAALVPVMAVFTNTERLALAGFLAGYSGLTREAYALDLRQFASWCHQHHLRLFGARRADIECFARDLEARGRARATVTRRVCTIAGFYRYAVEEELLDHSPAAHVRRPRLDYESHATGLDRNELGALLVAAGLGPPAEHALISLLALNGLRVSEATGASIQDLGVERGHRTLVITRKGGKIVTIPLAPRTARAIDLAIGERCEGPIFLAPGDRRLDRHGAGRTVRRIARRAGITKPVGPHTLRHAFITAALDAGVPLRDVQEAASHADPRTTMGYDRARASLDRHATYIVAAYIAGAARYPDQPPAAPPGQAKLARRTTRTLVRPGKLNSHVTMSNALRRARAAVLRGRWLDSDHDAGRPDPGILRAHWGQGWLLYSRGSALLPRVRQTRAGGQGEPTWVPSGVAFRPPARRPRPLILCLPGRGDIPVLEIMRHCVALPWDTKTGSLPLLAWCGSLAAGVLR